MARFHDLIPVFKERIEKEFIREQTKDTDELFGVPYPYLAAGKNEKDGLYYFDTYFANIGLIRMKMVDLARHNVDNLIYLLRSHEYVPASNRKTLPYISQPPMLPWMVRDIYRATGEKEWLRRVLPNVIKEFQYWTDKAHRTPSGLYHYVALGVSTEKSEAKDEMACVNGPRFKDSLDINPVDLNAILARNAEIIFDLQKEAEGNGDESILNRAGTIKKMLELCWNQEEDFYFDNKYIEKALSNVKALTSFAPLFTKLVPKERATIMQRNLADFVQPGGLTCLDKPYDSPSAWNFPLCYASCFYMTVRGLFNYDFMEDAADLGTNWLQMVTQVYDQTGELWDWYNAKDKSHQMQNLGNSPVMGWTMGVYVALADELGLE